MEDKIYRVIYHGCIDIKAKSKEDAERKMGNCLEISDKELIEGIAFYDLEIEEVREE